MVISVLLELQRWHNICIEKDGDLTPIPSDEYEKYIQKKQIRRRIQIRRALLTVICFAVTVAILILLIKLACTLFRRSNSDNIEPSPQSDACEIDKDDEISLSDNEKWQYITENPELYTEALIEFAQKYPQVLDYVYRYPEEKLAVKTIDLSTEAMQNKVPLLVQWDSRWGYISYAGGLIGYSGCGPTCMSMISLYLTGNPEYTPPYLAALAEEKGYIVEGDGTTWDLMRKGCDDIGISCAEIPLDENLMVSMLRSGAPIICALGPGDFTYAGHYIVIREYRNDSFVVNDPNNPANSEKKWTYNQIKDQINNIWAFWGERLYDKPLTVITDDINIRSEPSFNSDSIGKINPGDVFTIERIETNDGNIWGSISEDKWISMAYVKAT